MKLDEVEGIATAFLKSKRNAETIKIGSVKRKDSVNWVVKGGYTIDDEAETGFTIEVNENVNGVIGYEFEPPMSVEVL